MLIKFCNFLTTRDYFVAVLFVKIPVDIYNEKIDIFDEKFDFLNKKMQNYKGAEADRRRRPVLRKKRTIFPLIFPLRGRRDMAPLAPSCRRT